MTIKVRPANSELGPTRRIGEGQHFLQLQRIACSLAEGEHDSPFTLLPKVVDGLIITSQDAGVLVVELVTALEYISQLAVDAWELSTSEWQMSYLVLSDDGLSIDVCSGGRVIPLMVYPTGILNPAGSGSICQIGAVAPGILVRGISPDSVFGPLVGAFMSALTPVRVGEYDLELLLGDD